MAGLSVAADAHARMDVDFGGHFSISYRSSPLEVRELIGILRVVFAPVHMKRTVRTSLAIGTQLKRFEHGDEFMRG